MNILKFSSLDSDSVLSFNKASPVYGYIMEGLGNLDERKFTNGYSHSLGGEGLKKLNTHLEKKLFLKIKGKDVGKKGNFVFKNIRFYLNTRDREDWIILCLLELYYLTEEVIFRNGIVSINAVAGFTSEEE